jgi:BlaI family transcriptional regulator, penicillinase repressor
MENKELTRAEEQVMQVLWKTGKGFLANIVEEFPEPRPAYTTIATVIRVLVRKGFIAYTTYGKVNEYYPLISKEKYFKGHLKTMVDSFFEGSMSHFTSCFTSESSLSIQELEEIRSLIEDRIQEQKKHRK